MDARSAAVEWLSSSQFLIAVAFPGTVSLIVTLSLARELRSNGTVLLAAAALTVGSAVVDLHALLGLWKDPHTVHALPFFPLLYLAAGRWSVPHAGFCYAGTFLTLLAADIVATLRQAWLGLIPVEQFFVGIGGWGWIDGLFLGPLCGAVVTWLVAHALRRGVPMRLFRTRLPQSDDHSTSD